MITWRKIRAALDLGEYEGDGSLSFTVLDDGPRLERAFPGSTVAIDHNPRISEWAGHRMTVVRDRELRHSPEEGWEALLTALRTNEHGAYVQTRSDNYVRHGALYFVEQAIYVPSLLRWVVIR